MPLLSAVAVRVPFIILLSSSVRLASPASVLSVLPFPEVLTTSVAGSVEAMVAGVATGGDVSALAACVALLGLVVAYEFTCRLYFIL